VPLISGYKSSGFAIRSLESRRSFYTRHDNLAATHHYATSRRDVCRSTGHGAMHRTRRFAQSRRILQVLERCIRWRGFMAIPHDVGAWLYRHSGDGDLEDVDGKTEDIRVTYVSH
jgi:hypothetical protein